MKRVASGTDGDEEKLQPASVECHQDVCVRGLGEDSLRVLLLCDV